MSLVSILNQHQPKLKNILLRYNPGFQYQYDYIEALSFKDLFIKIDYEIEKIIKLKREIESQIPG